MCALRITSQKQSTASWGAWTKLMSRGACSTLCPPQSSCCQPPSHTQSSHSECPHSPKQRKIITHTYEIAILKKNQFLGLQQRPAGFTQHPNLPSSVLLELQESGVEPPCSSSFSLPLGAPSQSTHTYAGGSVGGMGHAFMRHKGDLRHLCGWPGQLPSPLGIRGRAGPRLRGHRVGN